MTIKFLAPLVVLLCAASAQADQTLSYPKKQPLVQFTLPDDWTPEVKSGSLFVLSPDGGDVIVEVSMLEAGVDEDEDAAKEAKATVEEDFKNLTLTPSDPVKSKGLEITLLGGEGEDNTGPAHINMALLKNPAAKKQILFSIIASKENASKHGAACGAMLESLSAAGTAKTKEKEKEKPEPKPAPAAAAKTQNFSYPDKAHPDFSLDFPADWKMKSTDEGSYVESPDKLVAMNVILVDSADTSDAEEDLKKKVGDRFKEIVWNDGKEPEVNKDEALGLTATFHNAVASDGEGTEKYSVNLVSYVRKKGDKTLILLCQNPLRALDKHGDAMEAVLKSIKVR